MSSRAKAEYKKLEREREQWEFENNPEGEIEEMIDLYKDEGIEEEDAKMIITKMAKYKELFLDVMMVQELELTMDDPDENYAVDGLVTFLSFFFFGSVPLLGYAILGFTGLSPNALFIFAIFLTCCTLFGLGVFKVRSLSKFLKTDLVLSFLKTDSNVTSGVLLAFVTDEYSFVNIFNKSCNGVLTTKFGPISEKRVLKALVNWLSQGKN